MSHRVARGESGSDDRRTEHEPDDDERATPTPAADATHSELHEYRVSNAKRREHAECDREREEKTDEERADRYAEDFLHRLDAHAFRNVGDGNLVDLTARR